MSRRYKIKWKVGDPEFSQEGFSKEECQAAGIGCDAYIFISLLDVDGGLSTVIAGRDGRLPGGPDISDLEIWKAWVGMAYELTKSETLSPSRKHMCSAVFETVKEALRSIREEEQG